MSGDSENASLWIAVSMALDCQMGLELQCVWWYSHEHNPKTWS